MTCCSVACFGDWTGPGPCWPGRCRPVSPRSSTRRSLRTWPSRRIDRRLRAHLPDQVLRARHRRRRAFVYFVPEHKSHPDTWVAVQTVRYELQIHEFERRRRPSARRLPLVVPMVWTHGKPSLAARDLGKLIDDRWPPIQGLVRRWRHLRVDLARYSERSLLAAPLPTGALLPLLFLQFAGRRPRREVAAALQRWAIPLRRLARSPSSQEDFEALHSYLLFTTDFPAGPLQKLLQRIHGDVEKTDMITTAQRLRRQGLREGRETGMAKGLAKGIAQGNRDGQLSLLRRLLTAKFGPLDAASRRLLRRATPEQIDRWSVALLTARTLRLVFAGEGSA